MSEHEQYREAVGPRLDRRVGRPVPERADSDALLADPAYYEPRVAKTPIPRGYHDCALRRGGVMCRHCDLDTVEQYSKTPNDRSQAGPTGARPD